MRVKNVLVPRLPARGNERVLGSETTMAHHAPACRADGFRTNIAERENTAAHTLRVQTAWSSPANKDTHDNITFFCQVALYRRGAL